MPKRGLKCQINSPGHRPRACQILHQSLFHCHCSTSHETSAMSYGLSTQGPPVIIMVWYLDLVSAREPIFGNTALAVGPRSARGRLAVGSMRLAAFSHQAKTSRRFVFSASFPRSSRRHGPREKLLNIAFKYCRNQCRNHSNKERNQSCFKFSYFWKRYCSINPKTWRRKWCMEMFIMQQRFFVKKKPKRASSIYSRGWKVTNLSAMWWKFWW